MSEDDVDAASAPHPPAPVPQPKPKRKREKLLKFNVLKQLEFYFSDVNLHKSRFMKEKMLPSESPNGNPVQIATLMTFNKLITMGATPEVGNACHGYLVRCQIFVTPKDSSNESLTSPIG